MNPKNKQVKDKLWPKTRVRLASAICEKTHCDWDNKVSFLHIPLVEEKFNCNIYIINVNEIPMLGSSISLMMNCFMYKSLNRGNEQYYLLYDDEKQHYDCITDIKQFLGLREFCHKCLRGFHDKTTYENHACEECLKPKKVNKKNATKLLKDLAHYIERGICKGSKEK